MAASVNRASYSSFSRFYSLDQLLSGKRTVRVNEVPLAASSLTQGDVYILDAAMKIYIFVGPTANMFEKTKGK
jgi:Gelsolin repeat